VPQAQLVDELFAEIDKSLDIGRVEVDESKSAEGAEWLQKIEDENADEMTPERLAALEAEQARKEAEAATVIRLDEEASPTAGRRFTRA
jgi:(E)-4-hydroxy-3-methylbut-2-enyl-diphosphate synthase